MGSRQERRPGLGKALQHAGDQWHVPGSLCTSISAVYAAQRCHSLQVGIFVARRQGRRLLQEQGQVFICLLHHFLALIPARLGNAKHAAAPAFLALQNAGGPRSLSLTSPSPITQNSVTGPACWRRFGTHGRGPMVPETLDTSKALVAPSPAMRIDEVRTGGLGGPLVAGCASWGRHVTCGPMSGSSLLGRWGTLGAAATHLDWQTSCRDWV